MDEERGACVAPVRCGIGLSSCMEYRRPISHGYLDPSHSLSTIDGIDSMMLVVVC